jgi:hypothetical protein
VDDDDGHVDVDRRRADASVQGGSHDDREILRVLAK